MKISLLIIEYIGIILSILFVLIILSGRREAKATFAWLFAIILFPYLGVLAYLFLGNPRLKRIINIKLKRDKDFDFEYSNNNLTASGSNRFQVLTEKVTRLNVTSVEKIELLPSATIKYAEMAKDILHAESYIFIEYYVFRMDEMGSFFLNLLTHKAKQGVKIFFLYDGIGAINLSIGKALSEFRLAGGNGVSFLSPMKFRTLSFLNFRNHRKIVVIDGKTCYTGGINIGNEYIGDIYGDEKWMDCHIKFSGNAVKVVEEVFCEDWFFCTKEDISDIVEKNNHYKFLNNERCHVIPSGPDQKTQLIYETLFAVLNNAETNVTIVTPYLVPDEPMIMTLKSIAIRGISVKIITPGVNNHPLVAAAGRSYYEELIESGVEIYETKNVMLHAKIVMVDGSWVTIGSANMDTRSFKLNFELNMSIYSITFVDQVNHLINSYFKRSDQISIEELYKKGFIKRIFEGICRALSPVL